VSPVAALQNSVLRSPLLPAITEGVASMPPDQGFRVMLRIISSMIAGVALCAARRPHGHPVRRCAHELVKVLPALSERPEACQLEQLYQVAEEVGAQIWHLIAFQADRELKADLEGLVSSICRPADQVADRPEADVHNVG
jgi:hypothetical protein